MAWFGDATIRIRARAYGRLRTNRLASELVAAASTVRYLVPLGGIDSRLSALLRACKRTTLFPLRAYVRRLLAPWLQTPACDIWARKGIGLARYRNGFGGLDRPALTTSLLLKAPGANGEKGVLYSSFEYNWLRLLTHAKAREFFDRYYLVGASSGAPPDFVAFAHLAGWAPDPVFIGVSNHDQLAQMAIAEPVIKPLPIMACDWVDPAQYPPKPQRDRTTDILMVANWLRLKRHWLLFEALRTMRRDLRVVLIGRNAVGRSEKEIRAEARAFGVRQTLELYTNIPIEEVARFQCDARISLLFSDREGSCVAPVESMFADTPVAMMRDAHVGSKAYINPRTGILVRRRRLSDALSRFLEERETFSPRAWAMEHVTCHHSSQKLNELLRDYAAGAGHGWTADITPLCWRYVPSYVNARDAFRMEPEVQRLRDEFNVDLVKFVYRP